MWDVNLLSKQLVVHLDSLHLFVALLQSLVTLTQLSDVVTGFGQDASFTLRNTRIKSGFNDSSLLLLLIFLFRHSVPPIVSHT